MIKEVNAVKHLHKDEAGILTLDFIFSSVLVFGFIAILFTVCLTLSVSYIVQYISYASARNYFAGHISQDSQTQEARQKYSELVDNQAVSPLFTNEWFEIGDAQVGDHNGLYPQSTNPRGLGDTATFWGTRIDFTAKILELRIPFFGVTTDEEDSFTATLASYLAREPTRQECRQDFYGQRFNAIKALDGAYNQGQVQNAVVIFDNGC
jgi:hypothetical protein